MTNARSPFYQKRFTAAAEFMLEAFGEPVTLMLRRADGSGFDSVGPVTAKLSELRLSEIVPGSSAELGDLRAIIRAAALPSGMRRLEGKDRIAARGREFAVIQYDEATSSIGGVVIAVSIVLRG